MASSLRSRADYKRALLVPIGLGILILLLLYVAAEILQQRAVLEEHRTRSVAVVRSAMKLAVERDTDKLTAVLNAVARNPVLREAFASGDRQRLLAEVQPLFQALRNNNDITHFYVIGADRKMFLRAQAPERFGDLVERRTLLQAQQTGKISAGLETGALGIFSLRVVSPWRDAAENTMGYLELGVEIDRTVAQLQNLTGVDLFMLIEKSRLQSENWKAGMKMIGRPDTWDRFPDHVLVGETRSANPNILTAEILSTVMGTMNFRRRIIVDGRSLVFDSVPLTNVAGEQVGVMLVASDLTDAEARADHFLVAVVGIALLVGALMLLIANRVLDHVYARLAKSRAQRDVFFKKAQRDGLTGLYRRNVFIRCLNKLCSEALPDSEGFAILMVDIDWFKRVNDTYGHPTGDTVLRGVARLLIDSVRPGDIVSRPGGEEFALILPGMSADGACIVAERIRASVEDQPFLHETGSFHVTLSIGIATMPDSGSTVEGLIAAADRALYAAKHAGRNQVVLSSGASAVGNAVNEESSR